MTLDVVFDGKATPNTIFVGWVDAFLNADDTLGVHLTSPRSALVFVTPSSAPGLPANQRGITLIHEFGHGWFDHHDGEPTHAGSGTCVMCGAAPCTTTWEFGGPNPPPNDADLLVIRSSAMNTTEDTTD